MRKNSFYLWAMMAVAVLCIGFTSCDDDDDDDDNKTSSTISAAERKLLGGWTIERSYGSSEWNIVLQTDGKLCHGSLYSWQYNEQTGILSTDVSSGIYNTSCQWLVTLISDDSWAGLELWHDAKPPISAKRADFITTARLLLTSRQWKSDTGIVIEGFRSGDFTPGFYYNPRLTPHTPSGDSMEIDDISSIWLDKASEDREKDVITIQDKVNECFFEIYHPYDSKKIYFQYPTGVKFYPLY